MSHPQDTDDQSHLDITLPEYNFPHNGPQPASSGTLPWSIAPDETRWKYEPNASASVQNYGKGTTMHRQDTSSLRQGTSTAPVSNISHKQPAFHAPLTEAQSSAPGHLTPNLQKTGYDLPYSREQQPFVSQVPQSASSSSQSSQIPAITYSQLLTSVQVMLEQVKTELRNETASTLADFESRMQDSIQKMEAGSRATEHRLQELEEKLTALIGGPTEDPRSQYHQGMSLHQRFADLSLQLMGQNDDLEGLRNEVSGMRNARQRSTTDYFELLGDGGRQTSLFGGDPPLNGDGGLWEPE